MSHLATASQSSFNTSNIQTNSNTSRQPNDIDDASYDRTISSAGSGAPVAAPQDAEAGPSANIQRGTTWPLHGFVNEATQGYDGPVTNPRANGEEHLESPWARKLILSFDGGGVRGYSSLLILQALMRKIEDIETSDNKYGPAVRSSYAYPWNVEYSDDSMFYPCHYFDYIAGTSTGGLSAIMLGRLRMSVDEALEQYSNFGAYVFGYARWFHERSILYAPWRSKYSSDRTAQALLDVISYKLNKEREPRLAYYLISNEPLASPEHQTRTMVVAFSKSKAEGLEKHYLFRSYSRPPSYNRDPEGDFGPLNPGEACRESIWRCARATSAAPFLFAPIRFNGRKFLDGGMGANNPAMIALKEVAQMHPYTPAVLVSLGTGEKPDHREKNPRRREQVRELRRMDRQSRKQGLKKLLEIASMGKNMLTNVTGTAGDVAFVTSEMHVRSYRFNVPNDTESPVLGSIPLDEWLPTASGEDTLNKIRQATEGYLRTPAVAEKLDQFADILVSARRNRAKTERWEKFATNVQYHCYNGNRCGKIPTNMTRSELRSHMCEVHEVPSNENDLEQILSQSRVRSWKKDPPARVASTTSKSNTKGKGLRKFFTRSSEGRGTSDTNGAPNNGPAAPDNGPAADT